MSIGRLIAAMIVGFLVVQVIVMVTNGAGGFIFNSIPNPETKQVPADADSDGLCAWNIAWYLPACAVGAWVSTRIGKAAPWRPVVGMVVLIVGLGVPLRSSRRRCTGRRARTSPGGACRCCR